MNDRELAEKVVALGVGQPKNLNHTHFVLPYLKHHDHESSEIVPLDEFVRDWRVAGALMEKVGCWMLDVFNDYNLHKYSHDWPRAIIEACVLALEGESE